MACGHVPLRYDIQRDEWRCPCGAVADSSLEMAVRMQDRVITGVDVYKPPSGVETAYLAAVQAIANNTFERFIARRNGDLED